MKNNSVVRVLSIFLFIFALKCSINRQKPPQFEDSSPPECSCGKSGEENDGCKGGKICLLPKDSSKYFCISTDIWNKYGKSDYKSCDETKETPKDSVSNTVVEIDKKKVTQGDAILV